MLWLKRSGFLLRLEERPNEPLAQKRAAGDNGRRDIGEITYQRCLSDLASVNRITLTHRPTLRWLAKATKSLPAGASFSVLDLAYGQGDLLRTIYVTRLYSLSLQVVSNSHSDLNLCGYSSDCAADVVSHHDAGDITGPTR